MVLGFIQHVMRELMFLTRTMSESCSLNSHQLMTRTGLLDLERLRVFIHQIRNFWTEGIAEGSITEEIGKGGFGYDPVFRSKQTGKTFAEMTTGKK